MMNLSCLSKTLIFSTIAGIASLCVAGLVYTGGSSQMILIACGVQFAAIIMVLVNTVAMKSFITNITQVSAAVQAGDFEARLVLPNTKGDLKKAADRINAMIDVNDAFVREAALALTAASEGRFYRKIRTEGMRGMFFHSIGKINEAIDAMALGAVERTRILDELRSQIGGTIEAAIAGDFTKRLQIQRDEDEFSVIATQINDLIGTVNRGLSETGEVLSALAQTDLSLRVEGDYKGDFLQLKKDTNMVADKLSTVIGQLRDTSGALKSATDEILEGANDLSERTLKQAATIEETSATMELLSNTVIESAKQADDASSNSQSLSQMAEESGNVVTNATQAMERITNSSAKISNVIGMIDDIAFQTNLLALNASVEAARAGEAGKGFAVVAVEVRRLAQSAAEASAEVKQLIEESASEVEQGSKFVGEVSENLTSMISSIQENSLLMEGLATSSREQASSIEEVNAAVSQMDEMTQHNAALVEETNAAIEQANGQVNEMDGIVDVFKLEASPEEITARKKAKEVPVRVHNQRTSDRVGASTAKVESEQDDRDNGAVPTQSHVAQSNAA